MNEKTLTLLRHWIEPAPPGIVRLHEDLLEIYQALRQQSQEQIDKAFDGISRKIGFVVATSVPAAFDIKDGAVQSPQMGAEHLKGTLFEELLRPLGSLKGLKAAAGHYNIHLIWLAALRLKLRTDWMEPAHFLSPRVISAVQGQLFTKVVSDIPEPVHWFDPGIAISEMDAVQIVAIDTAYPELELANQIAAYRDRLRTVGPGVQEPQGATRRPL